MVPLLSIVYAFCYDDDDDDNNNNTIISVYDAVIMTIAIAVVLPVYLINAVSAPDGCQLSYHEPL